MVHGGSGKKNAHKHKLFGPVALGTTPGLSQKNPHVRKIRVRNSGPEMAAPILWAPRISAFFLQENLMSIKFLVFFGGGVWFGGGKCRFYFYGRVSQGQTQVFALFYTMEAQLVPGTNPVRPWDNPGDEGWQKKIMC